MLVEPTSRAQMSKESVGGSHLLDVFYEGRQSTIAIEEDR
jgi:hypothetical protein